jgi:two-component system repressor protein LuxO
MVGFVPLRLLTSDKIIRPFEEIQKEAILKTIEYCDGNVCKAASVLKISHGTIYNKLKGWKNKQK